MLDLYLTPDFKKWYSDKKFVIPITEDNIRWYYLVYQKDVMCREKRCVECSGMLSTYESEEDIARGKIVPKTCLYFEGVKSHAQCDANSTKMLANLKIPARYDTTWSGLTTVLPQARDEMIHYTNNFPNNAPSGLYIHGTQGSGKTTCLWLIIRELLAQKKLSKKYVFMKAPQFFADLRADSMDMQTDFYREVVNCSILILDDFGRHKPSTFTDEKIYTILDTRLDKNMPVIIASHLPLSENLWVKDIELAILSRIRGLCQDLCIAEDHE